MSTSLTLGFYLYSPMGVELEASGYNSPAQAAMAARDAINAGRWDISLIYVVEYVPSPQVGRAFDPIKYVRAMIKGEVRFPGDMKFIEHYYARASTLAPSVPGCFWNGPPVETRGKRRQVR